LAALLLQGYFMRVAVPIWAGRVSPQLDAARRLLVVEVADGHVVSRAEHLLALGDRATSVVRIGVDILICGAISRRLERRLTSLGVEVVGDICGAVDEVIEAFIDGSLGSGRFAMPGSCRRRRSSTRPTTNLGQKHA
jgi:predicted Fe-Mo cluster-binding NifX family protein